MSLPSTKATTATATHAVVQAVETYIQNQNLLGEIAELDELLYDLIELHKDNELALKRVLQCIYNLLQSNNKWNVKFGSKVFHKLISVVIADSKDDGSVLGSLRRQLVANVLICVQIHARKFPREDGKFLLGQLWSLSLSSERQPHAAHILIQLFDDFVRELQEECACSAEMYAFIQSLLQSEVRDQRKSAYFLMKKILMVMQAAETEKSVELSARVLETLKCNEQCWSAYVVIMETLEEQQSHLVLPTLGTLLPSLVASNQDAEWLIWLRILYDRLLKDNNILVLRWTLDFFFNRIDVGKLSDVNLLSEFLAATNRTQLYNVESNFLPSFDMQKFISPSDVSKFLDGLATVQWHSAPLHFWLDIMHPVQCELATKNELLQVSARVRTLKNSKLRQEANQRIFELFEVTIDSLSLGDYLVFIETLFNVSDTYNDDQRFMVKLRNCDNIGNAVVHMTKRCFEVIVGSSLCSLLIRALIKQLSKLPNAQHGWWRLFPLFQVTYMLPESKQICFDFYSSRYKVDIERFVLAQSIEDVQEHLLVQLNCSTKEEKSFIMEHCIDWFARQNLRSWSQLAELNLQPCILLESGTQETINHLSELLVAHDTRVEDESKLLKTFLALLKKYNRCEPAPVNIVKYAAHFLNANEREKLLANIVSNCYKSLIWEILINCKDVPVSIITKGILNGEISTGDARIEAAYADSIVDITFDDVSTRNEYINFSKQLSQKRVNAICAELLRTNTELTVKKPRYFENCKEHRIKIRCARALLKMKEQIQWSKEMWTAVLAPNDQLNISYMYECLVGQLLPSLNQLLNRMQLLATLKPSQQVSIISIVHIYCMANWTTLSLQHIEEIVALLMPQTMGAHFQTRLLAQLVLYRLAVKFEEYRDELPILTALKTSIEKTLGAKLHEFDNEARLLLPEIISECSSPADFILYMTNTPFDEYDSIIFTSDKTKANIDAARSAMKAKRRNPTNFIPNELIDSENFNVQRKMNPLNDIYTDNDLAKTEEHLNERELIVVASLIDKLPNLGGLARTCEVLGVKTLVLAAKSLAVKCDFTNLSMTAEKTLNIVEVKPAELADLLIAKQSLGYKIVGAEQTAHSVSFEKFKFPEKCILLLGHEKHGIPVDLIAMLDFAVEVPQFGAVRSLNVHVAGSLFIWEYCKQHLQK